MVVYLTALTLSFFEHTKSAGPSLLLNLYLTISILFDAVRIRTLWLLSSDRAIAALSIVCLVVKVAVLILEECGKRQWLLPSQWPWSTEVTGGIFNRTLFVWLDSMMWKGYSNALAVVTLPDIDSHLLSESLWNRIEPTVHRGE